MSSSLHSTSEDQEFPLSGDAPSVISSQPQEKYLTFSLSTFANKNRMATLTPYLFYDLQSKYEGIFLAGGSLRPLFNGIGELEDYDVFFKPSFFAKHLKEDLEAYLIENHGFEVKFRCPQGELVTLKNSEHKIQLITKFQYYTIEECLDSFDINACRIGFDGENIITTRNAIRDNFRGSVTINKVTFPYATFKRILKYAAKGYKISNKGIATYLTTVYTMGTMNTEMEEKFYID